MKIYNFFPQISFKNGHVHLSISKQFCKFQQVPEAIQVMQDSNLFGCVIFFFFGNGCLFWFLGGSRIM